MIAGVLCGPTSVGKSRLALKIAGANGFEIISADSRQIYRGFEIGTNAPTQSDRKIPHHFIGFVDPALSFSPREYPTHVHALLNQNQAAKSDQPKTSSANTTSSPKKYLIVGGTGLYLKELLYPSPFDRGPTPEAIKQQVQQKLSEQGLAPLYAEIRKLDPAGTENLHPNDIYRITKRWENFLITGESYQALTGPMLLDSRFENVPVLALELNRDLLYKRIDQRVEEMVALGWQREVESLIAAQSPHWKEELQEQHVQEGQQGQEWQQWPALSSLGYREMTEVILGKISVQTAVEKIQKQTRNYAKRQLTFFRHQLPIAQHWQALELETALEKVQFNWQDFLTQFSQPKGPYEGPRSGPIAALRMRLNP